MSEETEWRVKKNLSQEFGWTECRILGAPSILDVFLLSSQVREQSGIVAGTSRNSNGENQEPDEESSQNDPYLEVGNSVNRSPQFTNLEPDEVSYINIF